MLAYAILLTKENIMSKESNRKGEQIKDDLAADDVVAVLMQSKVHKPIAQTSGISPQPKGRASDDTAEDLWDNVPI
jgi:hypothetical protein